MARRLRRVPARRFFEAHYRHAQIEVTARPLVCLDYRTVGRDMLRMLVGTCGPDQVEGINEFEGGLEALPGLGFADNGQAKHYSRTQRITSCTGNQIEQMEYFAYVAAWASNILSAVKGHTSLHTPLSIGLICLRDASWLW